MKARVGCVPCYLKQALSAAREVTDDPELQLKVLRAVAEEAPYYSLEATPAENSTYALWVVNEVLNCTDPFDLKKKAYNQLALEAYPRLKEIVDTSEDGLRIAVKIAAAGNIVDLGILGEVDVEAALAEASTTGFAIDDFFEFARALSSARRVLYLGDNAGEIVFDRILIEEFRDKEVIFAVKGAPILNDATLEDAWAVGIDNVAEVISNGSPMIGTNLQTCSAEFQREFWAADLIIGKGQGNFETLDGVKAPLFFILRAKCEEVANELGVRAGDVVLVEGMRRKKRQETRSTDGGEEYGRQEILNRDRFRH